MAELIWKGKHAGTGAHNTIGQEKRMQLVTEHLHETGEEAEEKSPWQNRLIQGNTSHILPLLCDDMPNGFDLIYIDPPFMTGRTFSNGSTIAYRDTWNNDLDRYLQWLYETFSLLYTLLATDGSFYVHLDWRTVHYAKILLDEIFGQAPGAGFKNEIIWHYQSGGRAQRYYARKHDTLLLYTRSADYCFHSERVSQQRGATRRNHMRKEVGLDGRITWTIRTGGRVYAYDEQAPMLLADVWSDISHLHQKNPERTGYATQKPEALLERIILASSEEHDLILDCCCGSGVTPVVAENLGRRWIACDSSDLAIRITRERLLAHKRAYPFAFQQCYPPDR